MFARGHYQQTKFGRTAYCSLRQSMRIAGKPRPVQKTLLCLGSIRDANDALERQRFWQKVEQKLQEFSTALGEVVPEKIREAIAAKVPYPVGLGVALQGREAREATAAKVPYPVEPGIALPAKEADEITEKLKEAIAGQLKAGVTLAEITQKINQPSVELELQQAIAAQLKAGATVAELKHKINLASVGLELRQAIAHQLNLGATVAEILEKIALPISIPVAIAIKQQLAAGIKLNWLADYVQRYKIEYHQALLAIDDKESAQKKARSLDPDKAQQLEELEAQAALLQEEFSKRKQQTQLQKMQAIATGTMRKPESQKNARR